VFHLYDVLFLTGSQTPRSSCTRALNSILATSVSNSDLSDPDEGFSVNPDPDLGFLVNLDQDQDPGFLWPKIQNF
jgi:hypothetical protein